MRTSRTLFLAITILISLVTLAGCASARQNSTAESTRNMSMPVAPGQAPAAAPAPPRDLAQTAGGSRTDAYSANPAAQANDQRMIIRTGEIAVVVASVEAARDQLDQLARNVGGYVANANLYRGEGDQLRGSVQIRIPAERWDETLAQVKALGREDNSRYGTNDVTEEFTDLTARARNLEATEKELVLLLETARKNSGKAEDIVAVYRELTTIRGEIERLRGRIQFLEKSVALATITVNLLPNPISRPVLDANWTPAQTLRDAQRALVRTLQGLGDAAIWAVIWGLPIVLVLGLPLALLAWVIRRWRGRRAHARA